MIVALSLSACAGLFKKEEQPAKPQAEAPKPPDKGDPQQRFTQALELWNKNQIQEAEDAFVALTKDFPEFSGPWTNLGILYARSNRRPQAIGAFSKAVTRNSDNAAAYNWLGILYRESNDLARAHRAYDKALSIRPDYALAHYNLAILLDEHLKRPVEALKHYQEYQRLAGKQDLKVMAWVAEIEAAQKPATPSPAPAEAPERAAEAAAPDGSKRLSTFESGDKK